MAFTPTLGFFESFINTSHTVLGSRLKPYCLRHMLLLSHLGSPMVTAERDVKLADLQIAVLICSSRTNEEAIAALERRGFRSWLWNWRTRRADFEKEAQALVSYLEDYLALPEFESRDDQGVNNDKIPMLLCHAAQLIKVTGWSEETVFNMPVGKLVWLNLAFRYLETGDSAIVSETELAAQEQLALIRDAERERARRMKELMKTAEFEAKEVEI